MIDGKQRCSNASIQSNNAETDDRGYIYVADRVQYRPAHPGADRRSALGRRDRLVCGGACRRQAFRRAARRAHKKGPRGAALSLLLGTTQGQGWRAPS